MIPESIGAVVAFLLLITPGFIWDRRVARYAPEQKETTLREASRIVIASLIATIPSTIALYWWLWAPALRTSDSVVRLLIASTATSALATIGVLFVAWLKLRGPARMHTEPVIYQAVEKWGDPGRESTPIVQNKNGVSYMTVTLEDGVIWGGRYAAVDTGPEDNNPLLCLQAPLKRKKLTDSEFHKYRGPQIVLLPTQRIVSIRIAYPSKDVPNT